MTAGMDVTVGMYGPATAVLEPPAADRETCEWCGRDRTDPVHAGVWWAACHVAMAIVANEAGDLWAASAAVAP